MSLVRKKITLQDLETINFSNLNLDSLQKPIRDSFIGSYGIFDTGTNSLLFSRLQRELKEENWANWYAFFDKNDIYTIAVIYQKSEKNDYYYYDHSSVVSSRSTVSSTTQTQLFPLHFKELICKCYYELTSKKTSFERC